VNVRVYALLLIIVSCFSCKQGSGDLMNEGSIEYKISYLENNLDNIATHLLPKKMILSFNDRYCLTEIEGFMGVFSISLVSDLKKNKDITMVKFFDSKYVHYGEKNEHSCIFDHVNIESLQFTDVNKNLIGFNANSVEILEEGQTQPYNILFTKDIGTINPNVNNPFSKIEGVLLQFELQLNQLRMLLEASDVKNKEINEESFLVPEVYKEVSRENMCLLLDKILETN
jgi:hypothetical protein